MEMNQVINIINMKKLSVIFFFLIAFSLTSNAQKTLKLGDNTGVIDPSAILDLDASTHKLGLKLPNVSLSGSNDMSLPSIGLIVYNTNTVTGVNAITPGVYIFDGTKWNRLATSLTGNNVSSLAGTNNQVLVNGTTTSQSGDVTLTLPQDISTTSAVQFGTVTATTFIGSLIGNATSATNISGGAAGSLPYQTGTGTAFTAVGTSGSILQSNGASTPTWVSLSTLGVSGLSAGTGISTSGSTGNITITNTGVTSINGSSNILASNTTGTVNLSLPTSVTIGSLTLTNTATSATVSGLLSGTTANFSGNVTSPGFVVSNATPTNILLANGTTQSASNLLSGTYVPYNLASQAVNLNSKDLVNVGNLTASTATLGATTVSNLTASGITYLNAALTANGSITANNLTTILTPSTIITNNGSGLLGNSSFAVVTQNLTGTASGITGLGSLGNLTITGTLTVGNISTTSATTSKFAGTLTAPGFSTPTGTGLNVLLDNGTSVAKSSLLSGSYLSTSGGVVIGNVSITGGTTTVSALNISGSLTASGSTGAYNQILVADGVGGVSWQSVSNVTTTSITATNATLFGSLTVTNVSNTLTNLSITINPNYVYNVYKVTSNQTGNYTATLPLASASNNGVILVFKFYNSNQGVGTNYRLYIAVPTSGTGNAIDGVNGAAATLGVEVGYSGGFTGRAIINVQSNGTSWWVTSVSNY